MAIGHYAVKQNTSVNGIYALRSSIDNGLTVTGGCDTRSGYTSPEILPRRDYTLVVSGDELPG